MYAVLCCAVLCLPGMWRGGTAFDLMKTRFQSALPGQLRPYSSTLAGLRTVFRDEGGLRGLYR